MNQFAKISPVVNSNGYLYEIGSDGTYESGVLTTVRLKEHEVGICLEDSSLVIMHNGSPLKLVGGIFSDRTKALEYVSNNDGSHNGELLVIKTDPTNIYSVIGHTLYSITENLLHKETRLFDDTYTSVWKNDIITNPSSDGLISGTYFIDKIEVTVDNTNDGWKYTYIDDNESEQVEIYPYGVLVLSSTNGEIIIKITKDMIGNKTIIIPDKNSDYGCVHSGQLNTFVYNWNIDTDTVGNRIINTHTHDILISLEYRKA